MSSTKVHSRHLLNHVDPPENCSSRRLADALLSWGVRGARRPNDALVTPWTTPWTTPRAFWATLGGTAGGTITQKLLLWGTGVGNWSTM